MTVEKRKKETAIKITMLVVFTIVGVIFLFPLFALLLASFKPSQELLRFGLNVQLQPEVLTLSNYSFIFSGSAGHYFDWYKNSVLITVIYTVLCLILTSMVGYALAVYQFRGKNLLFGLVLAVMMLPVEIIMLPLYKLMITLKMINTYWGVILPFVVAPLPIFFFRQYASGCPAISWMRPGWTDAPNTASFSGS